MKRVLVWAAWLLFSTSAARAACDPAAIASIRAEADVQCPCATAASRVAYVQCVARVAKAAAKSAGLPKTCRAAVLRCAKKSTCGGAGFVTCCRTTAKGATRCSVRPSEAKCTAPAGGSACMGQMPSCCDSCEAGTCGGTTTTTMPGPRTHVVMVGPGGAFVFKPAKLTVAAGDTVRWVWQSGGHSVVSGAGGNADGRFCSPSDSGCADPPLSNDGFSYEHTFTQGGTFPYYCSAHVALGMTGTIAVQ